MPDKITKPRRPRFTHVALSDFDLLRARLNADLASFRQHNCESIAIGIEHSLEALEQFIKFDAKWRAWDRALDRSDKSFSAWMAKQNARLDRLQKRREKRERDFAKITSAILS